MKKAKISLIALLITCALGSGKLASAVEFPTEYIDCNASSTNPLAGEQPYFIAVDGAHDHSDGDYWCFYANEQYKNDLNASFQLQTFQIALIAFFLTFISMILIFKL